MTRGRDCPACGGKTEPLDALCLRCSAPPGQRCQGRDGDLATPHAGRAAAGACRDCQRRGNVPLTLELSTQ